jgi:single-strand DNA-binding protein
MSGFNQAVLLGRLTAPAEQLTTKNGKLFIKAIIAASVYQKNSEGASEERTSFVPVMIFGRTAETFLKFVHKGDMVHLAGRLDSNEWTTGTGEKRLSLSFVVEQLSLLPNERANTQPRPQPKRPEAKPPERRAEDKPTRKPELDENGDPVDLPF